MHARLSLLMFLMFAAMGCWIPVFSVRLQELRFTPRDIALASATAAVAYLIAPVAAGQVADRWFAAERCIAVGGVVAGALMWYLAGLDDPEAVFGVCLVYWMVMVPVVTIANALTFTHLHDPARHFGKVRLWGTVGWVTAAWLVGLWLWLGRQDWWHELWHWVGGTCPSASLADIFRVGALTAFALAAYALTLPHTPPRRRGEGWLAPLQALRLVRQRDFAVYLIGSLVLYATIPFNSQVTPLLLQAIGFAREDLGPLLTIAQSMEILMLAVLPRILGRLGVRGTMLLGLTTWTAGLSVFALGQPTWLVVAALACNGVCVVCYMVAGQVFLNSRAAGHIRASTQSLLVFVNGLGLLVGNLLVGEVRERTKPEFMPTYLTGASLALAVVVFFLVGFPRTGGVRQDPLTPGPSPPKGERGGKTLSPLPAGGERGRG
jgi:nucleoside transporter